MLPWCGQRVEECNQDLACLWLGSHQDMASLLHIMATQWLHETPGYILGINMTTHMPHPCHILTTSWSYIGYTLVIISWPHTGHILATPCSHHGYTMFTSWAHPGNILAIPQLHPGRNFTYSQKNIPQPKLGDIFPTSWQHPSHLILAASQLHPGHILTISQTHLGEILPHIMAISWTHLG